MTYFRHAAIVAAVVAGATTASAQTTIITREPVSRTTAEGDAACATNPATVEDLAWIEAGIGIEDHGGRARLPVQRQAPERAEATASMRGIVGHGR